VWQEYTDGVNFLNGAIKKGKQSQFLNGYTLKSKKLQIFRVDWLNDGLTCARDNA
jgi:hypothetical protein